MCMYIVHVYALGELCCVALSFCCVVLPCLACFSHGLVSHVCKVHVVVPCSTVRVVYTCIYVPFCSCMVSLALSRLICEPGARLGRNGVDDFKSHPFFAGIDWDNIRQTKPPYIPEYSSPTDTRNFELLDDNDSLGRPHTVGGVSRQSSAAMYMYYYYETPSQYK